MNKHQTKFNQSGEMGSTVIGEMPMPVIGEIPNGGFCGNSHAGGFHGTIYDEFTGDGHSGGFTSK